MRQILRPIRFLGIVLLLAVYLVRMGILWMFMRENWQNIRKSNRLLSFYCRVALFILSVKPRLVGLEESLAKLKELNEQDFELAGHIKELGDEGGNLPLRALFVGNHLSYTDIIIFSSHISTCFVTSMEIKETPVLGHLCRAAGCLFVERRNRRNLQNEISEVADGLKRGLTVTIFPEATSTNGEQILRFRKGLFVSSIQAQAPVVPFTINYHTVGGDPISLKNRDNVFWYGDMGFVSHLWRVCATGGIEVDIVFRNPIHVTKESDPIQLAHIAQTDVEYAFKPVK
jgi:1-acyl-sn-glycerol-3-phosphate acyltransferase